MDVDAVIEELARDERSMRFKRLKTICDHFFGQPRIRGWRRIIFDKRRGSAIGHYPDLGHSTSLP